MKSNYLIEMHVIEKSWKKESDKSFFWVGEKWNAVRSLSPSFESEAE